MLLPGKVFTNMNDLCWCLCLCSQWCSAGRWFGAPQRCPLCRVQHMPRVHREEPEPRGVPGHDGIVWDSHQWRAAVSYRSHLFCSGASEIKMLSILCVTIIVTYLYSFSNWWKFFRWDIFSWTQEQKLIRLVAQCQHQRSRLWPPHLTWLWPWLNLVLCI